VPPNATARKCDFRKITEHPGQKATREQLVRLFHRYHFAQEFAAGKKVLEVGCGSGLGLGYLAKAAQSILGGDIDPYNVDEAVRHYHDYPSVSVAFLDAYELPLGDGEVDVIVCLETLYYLEEPERFLEEASRVLKSGGTLIISTVNKDWREFYPSIYSRRYFSVPEMNSLLKSCFRNIGFYGAFETRTTGAREKLNSWLKRVAVRMNIMPGSPTARALLKRVFVGRLQPIPDEIYERMTEYIASMELSPELPTEKFKMFYVVAQR
jgi:ubiquinone/menaquinone biosynthesis C-methylase UbiE